MNLNEQLTGIINDLQAVLTESTIILGAILILIIGLVSEKKWLLKGLFSAVLAFSLFLNLNNDSTGLILQSSLQITSVSLTFGSLFIALGFLLLSFQRSGKHLAEYYFFILAILAGGLFMMKANSLLVIYLSIELASLASYLLTNFAFKKAGFEAGIKYLLFGAISSAIMLFGLGLIYGATGEFLISTWTIGLFDSLLSQIGMILLLFGIFFKISLMPAHIWVPATYQEAPADAVAYMSIVPKIAGLILLMRVFTIFDVDHWIFKLVMILGMLTIISGTLGALRQQHARRMISFGAIAHSGFLLPFALMGKDAGSELFWYYSVVYAVMNLAVFYLLDIYERNQIYKNADYAQSKESTWAGVTFTVVLISLVGLPPVAGFTAKLFLFTSLWDQFLVNASGYFLAYLIVAVLATIGSLFFYLRIPKHIFLSPPSDVQSINIKFSTKILATLFCIVLLLLFFVPQLVMEAQQLLNIVHE